MVPSTSLLGTAGSALAVVTAALLLSAPASASPVPQHTRTVATPSSARPGTASPALGTGTSYAFLRRGDTLGPGDDVVSTGFDAPGVDQATSYFGTDLILQGDGNLVEYVTSTGVPLWASGTAGSGATTLVFQDDGNVVLYTAAGVPVWATGTNGSNARYFYPYGNGTVVVTDGSGTALTVLGPAITNPRSQIYAYGFSPDGRDELVVQDDGNVVAYDLQTGRPYWATGTAGAGRVTMVTQDDGNIVLYQLSTGRPIWASGTGGTWSGFDQLDVQDDGNIVLYGIDDNYQRSRPLWATSTFRS